MKHHAFKPVCKQAVSYSLFLCFTSDFSKAVNKEYEEYVLTVGDFDERVFLGADADEEIGTPRKSALEFPGGKLSARMQVECNLQQHFEKVHKCSFFLSCI